MAKVTVVDAGADLEWEFKEGEAGWGRSVWIEFSRVVGHMA